MRAFLVTAAFAVLLFAFGGTSVGWWLTARELAELQQEHREQRLELVEYRNAALTVGGRLGAFEWAMRCAKLGDCPDGTGIGPVGGR